MHFTTIFATAMAVLPLASTAAVHNKDSHLDSDAYATRAWINQQKYQRHGAPKAWATCNDKNTVVRKEWSQLTKRERKKYIAAVKCLGKLEAKTPLSEAPGVRRRYDDFVATHINQTFTIHSTGNFLGWHRFLTWTYEQTLRNECGYDGYQPYYNWPKWAADPASSPIFDGSDTSMSGNGELGCTEQKGYGIPTNEAPLILIPHGEGGGCIKDGPFKDFGVNVGPVFTGLSCEPPNPISNVSDPSQARLLGLGYNPRCLKRDISPWTSSQWSNDKEVVSLLKCKTIYCFWAQMQGGIPAFANNFMGVHTAGHFTVSGDPGSDFAASNGDPYFYLHHAQIDRVWWMWQNQQPYQRTNEIYGTLTMLNSPPSRNATLDDDMNLGYASPMHMTLGESMSTMNGPFCYRYT